MPHKLRHGESDGKGGRWCETCRYFHGSLYRCASYPRAIMEEIDRAETKFRDSYKKIKDPVARAIFGWFAGE